MLRFSCEHCGAPYRVADGAAGKLATCQKCGQKIRVPPADNSDSPGVPAASTAGDRVTAQAGSADAMADLLAALSTAQRPAAAVPPAAQADVPVPAPQAVPAVPVSPVIPVVAAPQADVSAAAAQAVPVAAVMELGPAAATPQGENPGQVLVEPASPQAAPDVPMARLAEPDGIPLAKSVRSKAPLLIGLGVIALVVLAVGLGLVLLQPPASSASSARVCRFRSGVGRRSHGDRFITPLAGAYDGAGPTMRRQLVSASVTCRPHRH